MSVLKLKTIETHTGGEPSRIVISGIPEIPGKTMPEKMAYLQKHYDHIRTGLMNEPRGHKDMFGAILTKPTDPAADFGIVYMCGDCYENMCGHNTIGFAVAAVERDLVPVTEPVTKLSLDTPAGVVHVSVHVENGLAQGVDLINVPAFVYQTDVVVHVPTIGKVRFDLSYGGNFYAFVKAEDIGVDDISPANSRQVVEQAMKLRRVIDAEVKIQHPTLPHITWLEGVSVIGPPRSPDASAQNCIVFGDGKIDRSPCGTATSARVALEYARGNLSLGEPFVNESILCSRFTGRALEEVQVTPEIRGIIPQISGTAFIIAENEFVFDDRDPLRDGFVLE